MRLAIAIVLFLFCSLTANATHIVGGEIYYDYLGADQYRITLKVYRDCINGQAEFDNPAYIGVYDAQGNLYTNINMFSPRITLVPAKIFNPCFTPPGNICVEEAIYETITELPGALGGYTLTYQRCCRNYTILNISNPGQVGATYSIRIPGIETVSENSSPRYNQFPPIFLCANVPFTFDHAATDPDGDSIVYELCHPFNGASVPDPKPIPPAAPPYDLVPFEPNYNDGYPLSSFPALSINFQNGYMQGTPNMVGQWVVAVCVNEYRQGKLLSTNKRDFQFNVLSCDAVQPAALQAQYVFCDERTVNFTNLSKNGLFYKWDFGDAQTLADTANVFSPSYTYADTGTYSISLIVNPGWPCADTATSSAGVYDSPKAFFSVPEPQCFDGHSFSFSGSGAITSKGQYLWEFNSNASTSTVPSQYSGNITFNTIGNFPIKLTVAENNCYNTYIDTAIVWPEPIAAFKGQDELCKGLTIQFENQSQNALSYQWDFGLSGNKNSDGTPQANSPLFTFPDTGKYVIRLIALTGTCSDTAQHTYSIYPEVHAFFERPPFQCITDNNFNFNGEGGFSKHAVYQWAFNENASATSFTGKEPSDIRYDTSGVFPITMMVSDHGCTDTFTDSVFVFPEPQAMFSIISQEGCAPYIALFKDTLNSADGMKYYWNFGDGNATDQQNTTHTYLQPGVFDVTHTVISTLGCKDTLTVIAPGLIQVNPLPTAGFDVSSYVVDYFNPLIDIFDQSTGSTTCKIYFGDQDSSELCTINHAYPDTGRYRIVQLVKNEYGCIDTSIKDIYVNPNGLFYVPNAFTPNGDGKNEIFYPILRNGKNFKMEIFNRWGELIFTSYDSNKGWTGVPDGGTKIAQQDVYVYIITYHDIFRKQDMRHVGHVSLIR